MGKMTNIVQAPLPLQGYQIHKYMLKHFCPTHPRYFLRNMKEIVEHSRLEQTHTIVCSKLKGVAKYYEIY